jgi:hypothetical protein
MDLNVHAFCLEQEPAKEARLKVRRDQVPFRGSSLISGRNRVIALNPTKCSSLARKSNEALWKKTRGLGDVMTPTNLNDPRLISEKGAAIYEANYREQYEREFPGKFVAINVLTEKATLGDTPSAALLKASNNDSTGVFHLIRVGHQSAYEVGMAYRNVDTNWIAR